MVWNYGEHKVDYITGWILDFFAYYNYGIEQGKIMRFNEKELYIKDFRDLASQMLIIPFTIKEKTTRKKYDMKYNVGFIGFDQNEKTEVFPVQGWIVSPSSEKERKSIL